MSEVVVSRPIRVCLLLIPAVLLIGTAFWGPEGNQTTSSTAMEWALTTPLPKDLVSHCSDVYSDTIYVMAGWVESEERYSDVVYSAKIQPSGDVNAWATRALTDADSLFDVSVTASVAVVSEKGWVYLIGGHQNEAASGVTHYAKIISDTGSVGIWAEATPTLPARYYAAAVEYNDNIYVLGGYDDNSTLDTVYHTSINNEDGTIQEWATTTPLLTPVAGLSAVEYGGRIYVSGGSTGNPSVPCISTVYSATIRMPSGKLSNWKAISTLPAPNDDCLRYHMSVVSGGQLYLIGGMDENWTRNNNVYRAPLNPDGTLGDWQVLNSPQTALSDHSVVVDARGGIYVLGGAQCGECSQSTVYYTPPLLSLTKSNDPSGPVHEGDVITYTITYANTGLVTQTGVVITDQIPSNTELVSVSSPPTHEIVANSVISWTIGDLDVGETGVASFQVRVPLLPSLSQSAAMLSSMEAYPPAQVLPVPIACDTTRFWAIGVTRQPPVPNPHTIQVQIPPGTSPSEMWLLMKETGNISPTVGGQSAQLVRTSSNSFGASLWTAPVTPAMVASGEVTVVTHNPRQLNALLLFDANGPPFEEAALDDFYKITKTFTYTLDIPSVATKTIDVILPFMDITYWTDELLPDTRATTVTVEFAGQSHTVVANDPNLGNGLLMTQFPFNIGPLSAITSTKVLTVTVDTEDSVYTLGPRVCRPVYIKNTAWLCSDQLGCISDTATNIPDDIVWPGPGTGDLYLPIILKSSP